jgi:AAA+ superfamily predicted ATPase
MDPALTKSIKRLSDVNALIFLDSSERSFLFEERSVLFDIGKPTRQEQIDLWKMHLGKLAKGSGDTVLKLTNQFDLNASVIQTIAKEATSRMGNSENFEKMMWELTVENTRPKISELSQRMKSNIMMDDLILPHHEKQLLFNIISHVKHKKTVYDDWGFKMGTNRGLGITALFVGISGTGKTTAAEAIANELHLDLFRIDLSSVVSKYIGETEKNLRQVFDAAEDCGAILFFDEADALFGKRSEVKDSHDRYANIEVGYLLQRMESYNGLAILATNMKKSIDPAFVRRIRFIVDFPFPDEKSRAAIWSRIFPKTTPVNGIDIQKLAKLSVTGGQIYNIAINASFLAAEKNTTVNMELIKQATKSEFLKSEQPLTHLEVNDW